MRQYTLKKRGGATTSDPILDELLINTLKTSVEINIPNFYIEIQKYINNNVIKEDIYKHYIESDPTKNELNGFESKKSIDILFFIIYIICGQYVTFPQLVANDDSTPPVTPVARTPPESSAVSFSSDAVNIPPKSYGNIDINNIIKRKIIDIYTITQMTHSFIHYNNLQELPVVITKTNINTEVKPYISYNIETNKNKLYDDLSLLYYCYIILNITVNTSNRWRYSKYTKKITKGSYEQTIQTIFNQFKGSTLLSIYVIPTFNILIQQIHNDLIYTFSPYNILYKYIQTFTHELKHNVGIMQICILLYSNDYTDLQKEILKQDLKVYNTFGNIEELNNIIPVNTKIQLKKLTYNLNITINMTPIHSYLMFLYNLDPSFKFIHHTTLFKSAFSHTTHPLIPLITFINRYNPFFKTNDYTQLARTINILYKLNINIDELLQ